MVLQIEKLNTGYDRFQVLHGLSMDIPGDGITAIIGPNGSGKSTILKAITGLLSAWSGDIIFQNKPIQEMSTSERIKTGIAYSPQGNIVFDELTVRENLEIAGFLLPKKEIVHRIDEAVQLFPLLKERFHQNAGALSGGEQQMLALSRALILKPKLLLLDEPSLGLSPNLIKDVFNKLKEINRTRKITMLIVEQKVNEVLAISDWVYGVKLGQMAYKGKAQELLHQKDKMMEIFL